MKHISEVLPKLIDDTNFAGEVSRLTNRHIAKLLTRLEERYTIEPDIIAAIKAQFRMFENDIINNVGDKQDEEQNIQD